MYTGLGKIRQQEAKKNRRLKTASIFILCFMVLYIPSIIHWAFGENIRTDIIRMGELEESVNTDAYFVRDEMLLNSPFDGRCILEVSEGEKVASNQRIATVINPSYEKLIEKLNVIDMEILKRQKQLIEKENFFYRDLVKIDDEIAEKLSVIIGECSGNSLAKAKELREGINGLIQKKAEITSAKGENDPVLKVKKLERDKLEEQLNKNRKEIISEQAGIISYMVDGYETRLNPKMLSYLTPSMLKSIKPRKLRSKSGIIDVQAGKPFAKLIKDIEYCIIVSLDTEKARSFKVDMPVRVRITETGRLLDGMVDFKSEEIDGRCLVAVTLDQALSETAGYRIANVDLIRKSFTGLKVPSKSLIRKSGDDGMATLILVEANYTKFVKVRIVGEDGEFAIIENIKDGNGFRNDETADLYDTFVVNPENIKEGQLVE